MQCCSHQYSHQEFVAISDQQIQVHFSAWWQSSSNTRDTCSCLSLHSWKQLQTPEQLAAPLHVYSTQLSLAGSAISCPQRLEFSMAAFSFRGAGNDLPLPPTTVHNTPVLVETISWLGHTKAAALFGNKLLKRSWEQPQTAALQQNLKHSLSLAFLSATSTKKEAFWGNPLRLGWDRLTHWVHNCSTVWSVTQGQNGA